MRLTCRCLFKRQSYTKTHWLRLGSWESAILRSCPVYYQDAGRRGPLICHKLPEVWVINCQALGSSPLLTGWTSVSCCSRSDCKSRGRRTRACRKYLQIVYLIRDLYLEYEELLQLQDKLIKNRQTCLQRRYTNGQLAFGKKKCPTSFVITENHKETPLHTH